MPPSVNIKNKNISIESEGYQTFSKAIQGNILKGHGRHQTRHIFFQFNAGKVAEAKAFIKTFAGGDASPSNEDAGIANKLTSAFQQKVDTDNFKKGSSGATPEGNPPKLKGFLGSVRVLLNKGLKKRLFLGLFPINDSEFQRVTSEIDRLLSDLIGKEDKLNTPQDKADFKTGVANLAAIIQTGARENVFRSGPFESIKEELFNIFGEIRDAVDGRPSPVPGSGGDVSKQAFFYGFYLTGKAYTFLGISDIPDDPGTSGPNPFENGMEASRSKLNDPPIDQWEAPYQQDIHGMILIAFSGDEFELDKETKIFTSRLEQGDLAKVLVVEKGKGMKNADGKDIEHFGYVDGVSQPRYFSEDVAKLKDKGVTIAAWDPTRAFEHVLVKDPGAKNDDDAFGSFFVYRKLEQDVKGYLEQELKLAEELFGTNPSQAEIDRTGAYAMGRFRNGKPVVLGENDDNPSGNNKPAVGDINDFNYKGDEGGSKCPFHSHVRKTNPRKSGSINENAIMARRGITWGDRSDDPNQVSTTADISSKPTGGVGLLFMAFQKSLTDQFEFTQASWANAVGFPFGHGAIGIDPVIGQMRPNSSLPANTQRCPVTFGNDSSLKGTTQGPLGRFVKMKGGEYFFAPSMTFLKNIS